MFSLRLFGVGCEYDGSHVVASARSLGRGALDASQFLAVDSRHVLVPPRRAHRGDPWRELDVRTGASRATAAAWSPDGGWTVVRAPSRLGTPSRRSCLRYRWTQTP